MEGPPRPQRGPVGTGRGGWPAALERKTEAPARRSAVAQAVEPLRVVSVPVSETTTGSSRPSSAAGHARRLIGLGQLGGRVAGGRRGRARGRAAARRRSGRRLSAAIRSSRRVGSIIGWARPRVRPSSPKSMTTWPSRCAGRRRRASSGDSGMLDADRAERRRRRRASPRRPACRRRTGRAAAPVHRAPRARVPGQLGHSRRRRAVRGQRRLDGRGQVGPALPERGPVDRRAQRRGVRLHVREHLGCRRLGHDDDRARWPGRRPAPRAPAGWSGRATAADRSRPPTPRQWLTPDTGGVEQAHHLLGAGAGGGHEADRAGRARRWRSRARRRRRPRCRSRGP